MKWNRREFVIASSAGLAAALSDRVLWAQAAPQQAAPAQAPVVPAFKDVRGNIGTFTARGGTIGYLVMGDGVVVVDSQFADTAPLFLDGLKKKTPRKIDLL